MDDPLYVLTMTIRPAEGTLWRRVKYPPRPLPEALAELEGTTETHFLESAHLELYIP